MMNARVLELLKNPENIQSEDLTLLQKEIVSFPYIQNIRALHLYGIHKYQPENYHKELSLTAAYTTDKKILYQLINGKMPQHEVEKTEEIHENQTEQSAAENQDLISEPSEPSGDYLASQLRKKALEHDYEAVAEALIIPKPEVKPVFVEGERNRILFPGEENFLNEEHNEVIDLESTLESGVIVTQKTPKSETEENIQVENAETETNEDAQHIAEIHDIIPGENPVSEPPVINKEQKPSENNDEETEPEIEVENDAEKGNASVELSEKTENTTLETETETEKTEDTGFSSETVISEDEIDSEKEEEKIQDDAEVSFHATSSFMPDVVIQQKKTEEHHELKPVKSPVNKHEEEMRRLIEQVENKMKQKKADESPKPKEEDVLQDSGEISFSETQDFNTEFSQPTKAKEAKPEFAEDEKELVSDEVSDKKTLADEQISETETTENTGWKPMIFESSLPDFMISKENQEEITPANPEVKPAAVEKKAEETSDEFFEGTAKTDDPKNEIEEENVSDEKEKKEDENVMNVSFFGSDIASFKSDFLKKEKDPESQNSGGEKMVSEKVLPSASNVPGFINTWQSWLKIDRSEEIEKQKATVKEKAIESFIENNPKISQLKDEVNFTVKEKNDDISHLMTETLANLYVEQKLYAKATKALQILADKHPERKQYFEDKIQELKESRNKN